MGTLEYLVMRVVKLQGVSEGLFDLFVENDVLPVRSVNLLGIVGDVLLHYLQMIFVHDHFKEFINDDFVEFLSSLVVDFAFLNCFKESDQHDKPEREDDEGSERE